MALYDLLGELSDYMWMAAEEKRMDKEFIASFLASRIDELSKIHSSAAYFLWVRATNSFMRQTLLTEELLTQVLGQDLAKNELAKRMSAMPKGIGLTIVSLESNIWISSIDALYRLKSSKPLDANDQESALHEELLDKLGTDALVVVQVLLNYFNRIEILHRLLTYYEPKLTAHIDEFVRTAAM